MFQTKELDNPSEQELTETEIMNLLNKVLKAMI